MADLQGEKVALETQLATEKAGNRGLETLLATERKKASSRNPRHPKDVLGPKSVMLVVNRPLNLF